MKLLAIYIGGKTEKSLIEVHDMRFVVAANIEDSYAQLRESWWGTNSSLHLDAWGELTQADGYNIELKNYPFEGAEKLYFINLGGYDSNEFTELHKNVFVVAKNPAQAKIQALQQVIAWEVPHRDYQYEIESCFCINQIAENDSLYIHLEKATIIVPFAFICKYVPI